MAAADAHTECQRTITDLHSEIRRLREEVAFLKQKLDNPALMETEQDIATELEANEEVDLAAATTAAPQNLPTVLLPTHPASAPPTEAGKQKTRFLVPLKHYPRKLWDRVVGKHVMTHQPYPHPYVILQTCIIAWIGIAVIASLHQHLWDPKKRIGILGSMGAVVVLLYAASGSPLAQPWNCIVGNVVGAIAGVASHQITQKIAGHELLWVSQAFAVAIAILLMHLTKSLHPPGGATALTVALGTASFSQGWMYVLLPVLWDCVILVVIALIFDNLSASMLYPKDWIPWARRPKTPAS